MLAALGRAAARRPWLVLLVWLVLSAAGASAALGVVGEGLFARLTSGEVTVDGEASRGQELLAGADEDGASLSLLLELPAGTDARSPEVQGALGAAAADVAALPGVLRVAAPVGEDPAAQALVGVDGRTLLVSAVLEDDLDADAQERALAAVRERLEAVDDDVPGASGRVSGVEDLVESITSQVEADLRTGEGIALPVSAAVMVVVFGGFLAAGIPVVGALASIAGGLTSLLAFSYAIDLDASVVNVVTVLGLGLCIDYGLLVVSRFREELRGHDADADGAVAAAVERSLATAGRTVVFSALTVAISLVGLLVFEADFLRAIGAAAVSVVLVALLVALTLVPALLAVAGRRLARPGAVRRVPGLRVLTGRLGDVAPERGRFSALARGVQRRPWAVLLGVTAVLLAAGAPALGMQLRSDGVELLPVEDEQRAFFTDLAERVPAASAPEVTVVADATLEEAAAYARDVAALDGVASVDPPAPAGELVSFGIRTEDGDDSGGQSRDVVRELREDRPDFRTWVTGQAAGLVDFTDDLRERAPLAAGFVVGATFLLLFLMTGSVLVPLKALVMNVVSLGATFGVLVWVFQEGNLEDLLGFSSTGGVDATVPVLALAFGFGLAMDYEVFLLSRITEARAQGLGNDAAVATGLQRSGRIISSAALIVAIVFAGFVAGELLIIKQMGVALAVAVAVDATLVRMLLVPATMTLLGDWNWWAPGPLQRLHARFGVAE